MKHYQRIEINPKIMFGKPVVKGTRITVEQILRKLAGGMTTDEILHDHAHLKLTDIHAAISFAADTLAHEEFSFVAAGGNLFDSPDRPSSAPEKSVKKHYPSTFRELCNALVKPMLIQNLKNSDLMKL